MRRLNGPLIAPGTLERLEDFPPVKRLPAAYSTASVHCAILAAGAANSCTAPLHVLIWVNSGQAEYW